MNPRTFLLLLQSVLFFFLQGSIHSQVIYVKQNASGLNNGTSWQDAFVYLDDALTSAAPGASIWIAAGLYRPGKTNPDVNSVFRITSAISLYGGFSGTEMNLEQRDPDSYVTILSGDLSHDDLQNEFSLYKSDNTVHVISATHPEGMVILDGLSIQGGHTQDVMNGNEYNTSGGGLFATGPVYIHHSQFTGNFGRSGGGIYFAPGTSGSMVSNCTFRFNKSTFRGAAICAIGSDSLTFSGNNVSNNQTARGSVSILNSEDVLLSDCQFVENENQIAPTACAGLGLFDNSDVRVLNCSFLRNHARGGAGIFLVGTNLPMGELSHTLIQYCHFEENENSNNGWGGAIYSKYMPDLQIKNSTFENNVAGSGGSIMIQGRFNSPMDTSLMRIDNCIFKNSLAYDFGGGTIRLDSVSSTITHSLFESGTADIGGHILSNAHDRTLRLVADTFRFGLSVNWGGAALLRGINGSYEVEGCLFEYNESQDLGGAIQFGPTTHSVISNSSFSGNQALLGGALYHGLDSTMVSISASTFLSNHANFRGGAIFGKGGSSNLRIDKSTFELNTAGLFGGGIFYEENGTAGSSACAITNSVFDFNIASESGAVIYAIDPDISISSSLLYSNRINGVGEGGTLSLFSRDSQHTAITLLNSTFADYEGMETDHIRLTTQSDPSSLFVRIQNCIFQNESALNLIQSSSEQIIESTGGNMSDDSTMLVVLNQPSDLNLTSPGFTNSHDFDFSLAKGSPGIDAGVPDGAPEFDILGNPRVNAPDMGAYENQMPVSVKEYLAREPEVLLVFPNPVRDQNPNVLLVNRWRGNITVQVSDLSGKIIHTGAPQKSEDIARFTIPLENTGPGKYQVLLSNGNQTLVENFVRIQ